MSDNLSITSSSTITPGISSVNWEHSFSHPYVVTRLERLMGSNMVRLTDKGYMQQLQDRIRSVSEEDLQKRVEARELAERERLKWLILSGKTPLSDCPPELYHHPVFAFWRIVNKEVEAASKKRADAYVRQQRKRTGRATASLPTDFGVEEFCDPSKDPSETSYGLAEAQIMQRQMELLRGEDRIEEGGYRLPEEEFAALKYESPDVKLMRMLKSVEELYSMADTILSGPQEQHTDSETDIEELIHFKSEVFGSGN